MALIRNSRVLERTADWVNRTLTLPHDMVVKVTAAVPPGVTDAVTQPDGRTIFVPPPFLTEIEKALADVVKTVERPAPFPASEYNTNDLTVLSTEFIFGHEMGHALQRQLLLANLGLEEDAADGFASFYTVNEVGPGPSLAAAILFDEIARKEGTPTLEGMSSDHPVTQQRAFNFLCYLEGSDPKKYQQSLVDSGYLPKTRAPSARRRGQCWTTAGGPSSNPTSAGRSGTRVPRSRRRRTGGWSRRHRIWRSASTRSAAVNEVNDAYPVDLVRVVAQQGSGGLSRDRRRGGVQRSTSKINIRTPAPNRGTVSVRDCRAHQVQQGRSRRLQDHHLRHQARLHDRTHVGMWQRGRGRWCGSGARASGRKSPGL
ncbi:DUF4344 domain-containing metallopeptidase [Streptomyces sp. NBC_00162]|uniref:DUF4344 domain-containing metallopeptidase n=1 Tax=Streptomyces sp. NBC_00162 TaxID=2903629 RepID=UPI00214C1D5A|nr:DUF4344 domain-containing metallopeptidase [Streptomyces sp. NBC_00162]UUU44190.1 DUF4344 domain-containing metallopeptidase [Streptomyces sp. NBC_00162]